MTSGPGGEPGDRAYTYDSPELWTDQPEVERHIADDPERVERLLDEWLAEQKRRES